MDKIELSCKDCGSKAFKFPTDPHPDDEVCCVGCGRTARYGDLHAAATKLAEETLRGLACEKFGKMFKGR